MKDESTHHSSFIIQHSAFAPMATLIYQYFGARRGGVIDGRVLIGRQLARGVSIDDPAVSRLHAWIDHRLGTYVLTDAGSRTGTFVNGEGIVRCQLKDGDRIRVGPVDLVFATNGALPDGVETMGLTQRAPVEWFDHGVMFYCKCGAPLWARAQYAGKRGVCRHCDVPVRVPKRTRGKRSAPAVSSAALAKCGVCHSHIVAGEETSACPDCGTTFHVDCWNENYGCSSYGCPQVGVLQPAKGEAVVEAASTPLPVIEEESIDGGAPWDLALLAGSVVGSVVGALLFGVPAIIIALAAVGRLISGKARRRGLVALAVMLALAGVVGGLALSDFWWFSGRHWTPLRRMIHLK
jgi:pSer/pThr/pTyr-binding forkhead associated (FHA) protein